MRGVSVCILSFVLLLAVPPIEARDSVLMRALKDELTRTMEKLQLEGMQKPYFVAYWVHETRNLGVSASLGGLLNRGESSANRLLSVEVRVGDHDLDNTRFFDLSSFGPGFGSMRGLPLADDYKELRRQIWLATDSAYKQALDQFSKKRAVLQNKTRVEEVPDFSMEKPYRFTDDSAAGQLPDAGAVEELAKDISAVFKEVPGIFSSNVQANLRLGTTYYVNSEGSSFTRRSPGVSVRALAGTQAVDGTELEDFVAAYGRRWEDLPSREELAGQIRGMADRLVQRREAEFVDRYNGPVLFEGQAAAELVNQVLAPRLLALPTPVTDSPRFLSLGGLGAGQNNPFLDKLGARVLPRFLSIIDDPTVEAHEQVSLLGGYEVDNDGVPAGETRVVERGILKTLLATRSPVAGVLNSTGNRRSAGPAPSNLFLVPRGGMSQEEMREELLALVQERGLDFGIVVRRLGNPQMTLSRERRFAFMLPGESGRSNLEPVTLAFKLYPDGREELIRKAEVLGLSESSFRDIVAASDTLTAYHTTHRPQMGLTLSSLIFPSSGPMSSTVVSLVVPQLLFEDVTLKRPAGDVPHLPLIAHP